MACADFLQRFLLPPAIFTAIGHGGGGKTRGAILRGMGVKPGWPDLMILTGKFGSFIGVELKAGKRPLSPHQRLVHEQIRAVGGVVVVARNLESLYTELCKYGVEFRPLKMIGTIRVSTDR